MTDEKITIGELGAYTNNSMNREGLKKLVDKVNNGGGSGDAYTKAETDALLATKQGTLTAGDNIAISEQNVISATDTKYTAGTNVEISEQNVISATDTKYTAGTGISISEQNVISASGSSNEWIEHTSTNWSDVMIFDTDENPNRIKALKDIVIYDDEGRSLFMLTKNCKYGDSNGIKSCIANTYLDSTTKKQIYSHYIIKTENITGANITRVVGSVGVNIISDGQGGYTAEMTYNTNNTTSSKQYWKLYYKD